MEIKIADGNPQTESHIIPGNPGAVSVGLGIVNIAGSQSQGFEQVGGKADLVFGPEVELDYALEIVIAKPAGVDVRRKLPPSPVGKVRRETHRFQRMEEEAGHGDERMLEIVFLRKIGFLPGRVRILQVGLDIERKRRPQRKPEDDLRARLPGEAEVEEKSLGIITIFLCGGRIKTVGRRSPASVFFGLDDIDLRQLLDALDAP